MNIGTLAFGARSVESEKIALICEDERLSYGDLDRSVDRLALWLRGRGLQPGARVAVHSRSTIPATLFYLACFRAGLIVVPVSARVKAAELVFVLRHSQATICFSEPALTACAEEARPHCGGVEEFLRHLPDLDAADGWLPEVDPDAPAVVLYTSGTTARPKGVTHSHRTASEAIRKLEPWGLDSSQTVLVIAPTTHITGLFAQLLAGLHNGATVVLLPAFDAATALDAIERHRVSMIVGMPVMMQMLIAEQRARPRAVASLRFACAGGDAAAIAVHDAFAAVFGIPLLGGYAMTETLPICANRADALRHGSLGTPAPGVEVRLSAGPDGDAEAGQVGEVLVRSSASFTGYWNDPEATASAFTGGWLRTGDLARQDQDGYYWFEGRTKELIVRGGSNVSPQEVEAALYAHPAVLEAGAVGLADALYGERVVACVALRAGQSADERALRDFAHRRLADHKVPEHIMFLTVLPKGPTGKIDRRGLKQMVAQTVDAAALPATTTA